ncbi:MAG TPA: hypothetical protein VER36_09470 [Flavisolibacter sp.]|nr:hypothetical protein [Flavisolibacter sp.]
MRWFPLVAVLLLASCSNKEDAPDVSGIKMDVTIRRFDKDFFSMDTTQIQASLQRIEKKYPAFLAVYFKYFAPISEMAQQQGIPFDSALLQYYQFIQPLAAETDKRFRSLEGIEKDLEKNLRYVKHYFPSFKPPVVLTSVESLNPENPNELYGTTYFQDTLVISLQMFLGKDYQVYDPTQYPDYIRRRFEPEYIVPNSIRAIVGELYADTSEGASLIEQMIEKGKQWWLMKKFLPETADSLITGYTAQQTAAMQREEGNIWGVITQNENLFSVEQSTIQTYIGEAPFTNTLPQGAPGNIGPWIGWRIIQKFEEENRDMTVEQILRTTAKKIFAEAKYKPK